MAESHFVGELAQVAAEKRVIGNFGPVAMSSVPTPGEVGPAGWKP